MFAVFRATPGSFRISSIVSGTLPPNSSTIIRAAPWMALALLLKNPVGRTSFASSSRGTSR